MKLFNGLFVSAALVAGATAANAQVLAPYELGGSPDAIVSDVAGPYALPAGEPAGRRYGGQMMLLPPREVYAVVRDRGFSPLGVPQQRGLVYTIAVIDRGGEDGRLVIDARNGRIIRFMPAYRMGDNLGEALTARYGPVGPPPVPPVGSRPRPPASIPPVASRTPSAPLPKPTRPAQQSAAVQAAKPAPAPTAPQASAPAVLEPKRPPQIMPTQELPEVQGLD